MVGASKYVPYNIWYIVFMHHQVYFKNLKKIQYNESAMRMDINGRNSCTGNSWHINIRYFLIKYWLYKGEISIMYYPTHLMLSDYFMKPLQVALFQKFREISMGRVSPYTLLKYIVSYSRNEHTENKITEKHNPSKKQI